MSTTRLHTCVHTDTRTGTHAWGSPGAPGISTSRAISPWCLDAALSLRKATHSLWWVGCQDLGEWVSVRTLNTESQVPPGDLAEGGWQPWGLRGGGPGEQLGAVRAVACTPHTPGAQTSGTAKGGAESGKANG